MAQQAATAAGSAQAAQSGLASSLGGEIATALGVLDLSNPDASMPQFLSILAGLVHRYGQASATLAARYYQSERKMAGLQPIHVHPASLPPLRQVGATVGWATEPLRSDGDLVTAETNLEGSLERLTLDVGRRTVVEAVQSDRRARGWARITSPGACSFCRLMATRGAIYKNEDTAGRDASEKFVGEGEFKFHNHCHCHIEPAFGIYEMTAQAREDLALYKKVTGGLSGAQARNAFRQAVEGRGATESADRSIERAAKRRRADVRPDVARKLIGQFEQSIQVMSQRKGLDKAIEAARERIAELQTAI